MSRALERRYRVRFAVLSATDINDSDVDFILEVTDLAQGQVPVVAGSFVHPLDGATELRPTSVIAVDKSGGLIQTFADGGRWRMLGRLVDIQWQNATDDAVNDPWTTYGTGRCSGLDEGDGPGKFRIEISDETWVARRGAIFTEADTTQLWPAGLVYPWRGFGVAPQANGSNAGSSGDFYRINVAATGAGGSLELARGTITDELRRWIENDQVPPSARNATDKNFVHLRLNYPNTNGLRVDWEVRGFGGTADFALPSVGATSFPVWIIYPGIPFALPAASGTAYLYAPTAPPSDVLPLHIGVEDDTHEWGYPIPSTSFLLATGGYLHPADLTRRAWEALGLRYNSASIDAIEADLSYPLLAPYILGPPTDPQKWLQTEVWGPLMLLALRDTEGKMKLVDIRPPADPEDPFSQFLFPTSFEIEDLPVLTAANSRIHRWRLVGREATNSITWEYKTFDNDDEPISPAPQVNSSEFGLMTADAGDAIEGPRLDALIARSDTLGPYESDNVPFIGLRSRTFSAHSPLEPLEPLWPGNIGRNLSLLNTGRGSFWASLAGGFHGTVSANILEIYQDGPFYGTCEIGGSLAETLEEGDYVIVDCGSVKIANAGTEARFGHLLVLLLSLTRFPAHTEAEYLVVRPVPFFVCPTPTDSATWLVSPFDQATTVRLRFDVPEPLSPDVLTFAVRARKNAAGGDTINMGVALYEGTTLITDWTEYDIDENWTEYSFTLDVTDQAAITDWTDLFLEITRGGTIDSDTSNWRRLEISKIWVP